MSDTAQEWFRQADYDMRSAGIMFDNRQYIHAVFMCHLAIEKALKGLYARNFKEAPPRTHNLVFLAEQLKLALPEDLSDFMFTITGVSVQTRYPDEIEKIRRDYNKAKTKLLLEKGKKALKWLKTKL